MTFRLSTGYIFAPPIRLNRRLQRCGCEPLKPEGAFRGQAFYQWVFKLAKSAEQRWLLLRGSELIAKVIAGVQFKNGVITEIENHQRIAA